MSNLDPVMVLVRRGGLMWHHFRTAFVRVCKSEWEFKYHVRSCGDLALLGERTLRILMMEEGMIIRDWHAMNMLVDGASGGVFTCVGRGATSSFKHRGLSLTVCV